MFFFFNDTATTEIYTLSQHDALPISQEVDAQLDHVHPHHCAQTTDPGIQDRKSTRLNSSHGYISYAVFCLKKKTHWDLYKRSRHRVPTLTSSWKKERKSCTRRPKHRC